jgi:hypothetical protein
MKLINTLILFSIIGLLSCSGTTQKQTDNDMLGLSKNRESIENFWTWFSSNEKNYRNFQDNPDKYLTELLSKVKKISKGLAVELEPPKDGIINMTISADGDANLFSLVQQIVDKAPKLDGWHFYAFRQRMPVDKVKGMILKAEDHELDPSKIKFSPIISGDTLDIIVYVDHVTQKNRNQVAYGCLMLLDNLLGEYDCVKKVRSYDFHSMPQDQREISELKPLIEIAQYVDSFHSGTKKN